MSCVSVDIWWNFTPYNMSWWTTVIWQTTNGKTPLCLTGLRLQDGGIVASSSLGLTRRKRSYYFSPFLQLPGCIMCTLLGQAPLSWLPWWQFFLDSILYCLIATVCLLLYSRLKICGQRPFWPDSLRIPMAESLKHTHYTSLRTLSGRSTGYSNGARCTFGY